VAETARRGAGLNLAAATDFGEALTGELIERAGWFIRLRWIAAIAVLGGTILGRQLGFPVPVGWLLLLAAVIAGYNLILRADWLQLLRTGPASIGFFRVFCIAQIVLDYLALTVTIHLTGGIESPLAVFFIFHIIVAAILLPQRSAYLDAFLASGLVGAVALTEGLALVAHHQVLFRREEAFYNDFATAGAWYLFLVLTFLVSSFIAATIGKSLERRLQDLYNLKSSLEEANARLTAADKEKSDFMNLVTHELRSPLVAIRGILQALTDQYAGKLNAQQLGLLRRTDRRAEQMVDMVNDLLRLAQVRTERVQERQTFDLAEVVGNVVELFRPQAVQGGVSLDYVRPEEPMTLDANKGDVRYVATNLVSNAVKYTPPGGSVTVTLSGDDSTATLEVKDTGIGIPEKDLPKLFTEFFRATNAKKQHAMGTGLGLAIIKKLAKAHGGDIAVESVFGKGSTFTLRLPRSATAPSAP
jgi:signal transduction histidine kinase